MRTVAGVAVLAAFAAVEFGHVLPTHARDDLRAKATAEKNKKRAAGEPGIRDSVRRGAEAVNRKGDDGRHGKQGAANGVAVVPEANDIMNEFLVAMLGNGARRMFQSERIDRRVKVRRGDTLMKIMLKAGIPRTQAHEAISVLRKEYDPRDIVPGQSIKLSYSADFADAPDGARNGKSIRLEGINLTASIDREVFVERGEDERFVVSEAERMLDRRVVRARGIIDSSLYKAGISAGVGAPVLVELIRIYSWDVDFQREIRAGDEFEVVFEQIYTPEGEFVGNGKILYSDLTLGGDAHRLYRFEFRKGQVDYFNEKGESARKPLLRTPVDGARLSSRYGRRRHPILHYTRMHRGVDFAAPRGTPVYAAGDGVITYRGRKGAYGRYVRIRHNSRYSTAYAHLRYYKRGQRRGSRVKQGQVIGYVGSSGRSTGPHLHYEILVNGRQVNPLRVRMPPRRRLKGQQLVAFRSAVEVTAQLIARSTPIGTLASN